MGICSSKSSKEEPQYSGPPKMRPPQQPQNSITQQNKQYYPPKPKPKNKNIDSQNEYYKFDEIKNPHKNASKPYLKFWKKLQTPHEQPEDYYAPSFKPSQDLDSNQYHSATFSDYQYINSIPKTRLGMGMKIDESKTMFFKVGHFPIYSESTFVFTGLTSRPEDCTWTDIENLSNKTTRNVNFPQNVCDLLENKEIRKYLMQAGWFVTMGHKWGFLLNLHSIAEAYSGYLHIRWKVLLQENFFLEIFEKFAEYIQEAYAPQNQKGSVPREIPSTDSDEVIRQEYVCIRGGLYLHQMQEVGWMFSYELYPAIRVPQQQNALQFLDTGYYLDSKLKNFIDIDKKADSVDIMIPGGVLASQIGSGKTITIIALTSIGTRCHPYQDLNQKYDFQVINQVNTELSKILGPYKPTLIIVTENILGQWEQEYLKFAPHLKVVVIENEEELPNLQVVYKSNEYQLKDVHVIITHRKVIAKGEAFERFCPNIFKVEFRRIIIDEFHELTTLMAEQYGTRNGHKSKFNSKTIDTLEFYKTLIKFNRRMTWGVTGTPDNLNYFKETTPLIKLLNLSDEFNRKNVFFKIKDRFVTTCMRKNPRNVELPELKKTIEKVYFGQLQNILYKGKLNYALNKKAAQEICSHLLPQWSHLDIKSPVQTAIETIKAKHQEEIIDTLNKLQNSKEDKYLASKLQILNSEDNFFTEVIRLISQNNFDCPLCLTECPSSEIVVIECLHNLCVSCYESLVKTVYHAQCPVCRENIQKNSVLIHPKFTNNETNKFTAIVKAIRETPPEDKIIIFTQFHSLVEHLSELFAVLDIQYTILRGAPSEINISLLKFKHIPGLKVLLMSVEQAASGINVPEANHIFFAHPIFGMEFEKAALTYNQCIGRAFRIGQMKEVFVKLFVTMESLEEDLIPSFTKYANTLN